MGDDCFTLHLAAVAVFVDSFLKVMNKFALVFKVDRTLTVSQSHVHVILIFLTLDLRV